MKKETPTYQEMMVATNNTKSCNKLEDVIYYLELKLQHCHSFMRVLKIKDNHVDLIVSRKMISSDVIEVLEKAFSKFTVKVKTTNDGIHKILITW